MVLYKATKDGNIPMTKAEEDQIKADWAAAEVEKAKPPEKTLEERVAALEAKLGVK